MKMKKLMSLLLVGAMSASVLAGCGGSSSGSSTSSAPSSDTAASADKADAAVDSAGSDAAPAAEGATWMIGGIGPISGDAAQYGLAVRNSGQIAVDEINAAGGINGYQIAYNFQDDVNDAEKAVNAYNSLKDWGMQFLMGTVTSAPCIAVVDYANEDNIFLLTPSGSAQDCIKHDNAFRICFTDPSQGTASAKYIGDHSLAQKVAIIYDSSLDYSTGIYESFMAEAPNQPFEVVAAEAYTGETKTDMSVQLQKAQAAGADLVFLPIYYQEASTILTQANDMGYAPIFFGVDGMDGILNQEGFDTSLAEGVMLLTPFIASATDDQTVSFVNKYQEQFNDTPNQFGADAYDAIYAIKAAVEHAGLTPDMGMDQLVAGMKDAMVQITVDGLTSDSMTWTADGETGKAAKAAVIKNGVYEEAK